MHTPELWLLLISFSINLAGMAALIKVIKGRGGLAYLKSIVLKNNEATVDPGSRVRREMYATLPTPSSRPIVFLGDSITVGCEWHEAYAGSQPILNRAIGGDTSLGVLERIDEVCRLRPVTVFLMIGTNDPQMLAYTPAETVANVQKIVDALLAASPDCRIYLQSVLPSRVPKFNQWSASLNQELQTLHRGERLQYLDLRPDFSDEEGAMATHLTHDGLHLNASGYLAWRRRLEPILQPAAPLTAATSAR